MTGVGVDARSRGAEVMVHVDALCETLQRLSGPPEGKWGTKLTLILEATAEVVHDDARKDESYDEQCDGDHS